MRNNVYAGTCSEPDCRGRVYPEDGSKIHLTCEQCGHVDLWDWDTQTQIDLLADRQLQVRKTEFAGGSDDDKLRMEDDEYKQQQANRPRR
jgi:uncharacterized Zn finger protein